MTAEIGRVLGGRYRLVAPIGMGASAQVYLADDVRLRRRVAVKMLHVALADDAEFLRRFRAEARAAAALSHPNVMAVYDWGDDEVAFIVSEYLGGGSLRALLDRGQLLTPSQALVVGLDATRALDYAHRRGFVHRDIKPANLLFGEEQRLRIADFGLARALAEAAWTEPQGAMLGTARYASPEQAKGETLSGKADVYSLALALIESVTGEVPFTADTTLGTLMARVDRPLVVPDELDALQAILTRAGHPDPEQRIDARTLAAGLLRAAKALPGPAPLPLAGALAAGLEASVDADPTVHVAPAAPVAATVVAGDLAGEGPADDRTADDLDLDPPDWVNQAEAAPLAGVTPAIDDEPGRETVVVEPVAADAPDDDVSGASQEDALGDTVDQVDPEAEADTGEVDALIDPVAAVDTASAPAWAGQVAAGLDDDPVDRVVDPTATVDDHRPLLVVPPAIVLPAPEQPGPPGPPYAGPDGDDPDEPGERRRRRWPWVALVLLLLAGGGGVAAATVINREPEVTGPAVVLPLPTLTGRTQAEATAVLQAAGWKVTSTTTRRDGTTKGEVLATSPAAGTRLTAGKTVRLTVSAGQEIGPVPEDLAGKTFDDAVAALPDAGFLAAVADRAYDEEVPKDSVLHPADGTPAQAEHGTTIGLVVSDGPEPRVVPSGLQGSNEKAAKEALAAVQLKVAVNRQFNEDIPEGQVVSVSPRSGTTVPRGDTVTIEVSRGPELRAVPSVRSAKTTQQAAAILQSAGFTPGRVSGSALGSPVGTDPPAGTMARPGTTVNIILG